MALTQVTSIGLKDGEIVNADLHSAASVALSKLASTGALGSAITATTQSASDDSTKLATTAFVQAAVTSLIDGAPGSLNTLNELAAAINDDSSYATTLTTALATKAVLTGSTNNTIATVTGSNALTGEANLTFDGGKLQVNSQLGIGIAPAEYQHLHVYGANPRIRIESSGTNAAKIQFADSGSGDIGVIEYSHSDNSMRFNTASGERFRITSAGYVGVKRSTPLANLHTTNNELAIGANPTSAAAPNATYDGLVVDGEAASFINIRSRGNGSDSYGRLAFSDDTRSRGYVEYRHKDGSGDDTLRFATAGSERFRIDSSGNITANMGSNAITSGYNYELRHSATYAIKFSNAGNSKHIRIGCGDPEIASTGGEFDIRTTDTNAIKFKTDNTERLRITSAGNLLIGKTADSGKPLEVYQAGNAAIRIQNSASGTGGNDGILLEIGSSSKDALIWNYESANMLFGTAGTERLRIDSSGNLAINTTTAVGKLTLKGTNNNGSPAYGLTNSGKASQGIDISCTTVGDGNFGGAVSFGCGGNGRSGIAAYQEGADDDRNGLVFLTHASTAGTDNAVERMRIHADGYITTPYQPCFSAKGTSSWTSITTGDNNVTLPMSYELFDNGANYNNSTYKFTAPVAGKYIFFVQMYLKFDSNAGYMSNYFIKNDVSLQENHQIWGYGNTGLYQDQTQNAATMMELAENDYVYYVARTVGSNGDFYGGHCTFSGYLLA